MKEKLKIFFYIFNFTFIIFFLLSCTKPEPTNIYDPEYELPAPTNLNIIQLSVTSCKLTWTDNSTNEQGFHIDRKKDSEAWVISYAEVGANVSEFTEQDLDATSTYSYKVYGFTGENTTTIIEGSINMSCPAPENLTYTLANISFPTADIHLDWDYFVSGIDGFKIKKNGTLLYDVIPAGTTDWIDVGVNIEYSNSYQLMAFFQSNNSAYSNEITVSDISMNGFVAEYLFTNNLTNDSSGYENHGTNYDCILDSDRFNNANSSIYLNGNSSKIVLPNLNLQFSNSISLWFKADYSFPNIQRCLYNSDYWDSFWASYYGFNIFFDPDGYLLAKFGNGEGSGTYKTRGKISQDIVLNNYSWNHLVVVFDNCNDILIYLNSLLIDTQNSGNIDLENISFDNHADEIGADDYSIGERCWKGRLDDIRIYNRALTDNEVNILYHEGGWDE